MRLSFTCVDPPSVCVGCMNDAQQDLCLLPDTPKKRRTVPGRFYDDDPCTIHIRSSPVSGKSSIVLVISSL